MISKNPSLLCRGLLALGLSTLLVAGCSPVSPPVTYYSLLDSSHTTPAVHAQEHRSLLIGPISIPDSLKNSQIATGGAEGQYQFSEFHRWVSKVDRDFARALGEQLAAKIGTEQIALYPSTSYQEPSLQIVVDILAMDGALGVAARLTVRWSLIDTKSKKAQLTRRTTFSEHPVDATHGAWVAAQRHNINRLGEEVAAAIRSSH